MTTRPGVDYSYGRPGGAALAKAGIKFACRYLSHTAGKNLSRAEAADLAAHGVSCVVVWETTAQRAGAGRAAGIEDAKEAAAQAKTCGQPASRPIYFAVDYDADPAAVEPYFQGVASVLGFARTAGYGGYRVIKYLLDRKRISWAWQTAAWSGGRWDSRAHIRQYASTVRIGGVSCDKDSAMTADYGQWTPGEAPAQSKEDDMPLTDADAKKVAQALLDCDDVPASRILPNTDMRTNPTWTVRYTLQTAVESARRAAAAAEQAVAQLGAVSAALAALTKDGGLTTEQITAAAQAGAQAALAELGQTLTKEN